MPGCCTWLFAGGMPFPACCGNVEVGIPLAPTSAFSVAPVSFPGTSPPTSTFFGGSAGAKELSDISSLERFTPVFSLMTVLGICDEGVLVESRCALRSVATDTVVKTLVSFANTRNLRLGRSRLCRIDPK